MTSLILRTATRYLFPLLLMFSFFLLLRGHDHPGGGFVGGLVAAAAFALNSLAFDVAATRESLRVDPRGIVAAGGLAMVLAATLPVLYGSPMLTAGSLDLPVSERLDFSLGTVFVFDVGVYLIVVGMTLLSILSLEEER